MNNRKKGFVGLTLVLTISTVIFILILSSSLQAMTLFDQVQKKQYRFMNYYNALSCIDQAILELSHDYFFLTDNEVQIPYFDCSILSIEATGDIRRIVTRGNYGKAYVYRSALARLTTEGILVIKIE